MTVQWVEKFGDDAGPILRQGLDNLRSFIVLVQEIAARYEKQAALQPNGMMGPAECIDCVKALAPMQKIIDCLAGGGAALVLWGTPNQIANAKLLRVIQCQPDHIIARGATLSPALIWAEGKDVELARPDKYILRMYLLNRFGA